MSKNIAAVVTKMVNELEGLKSDEERERAFAGARAVLGMAGAIPASSAVGGQSASESSSHDGAAIDGIASHGMTWVKRSGLSQGDIEKYFHIDGGKVTLIGEAIGKGKREQSINTYLLTGVASLLETGRAEFTDQTARDYCTQLGCYDPANHSATLSQFGNRITGSKAAGWKLTAPGLSVAAAMLKPKVQEKK
ncbi:MAG: hypothetical protein AB7K52_07255 [Phycisphaerales bacterium]